MDTLFTSSRILIEDENSKNIISGGVLVSNVDGTIKKIFKSQEEINSWMFKVNSACDAYDYGDLLIMPGIIDVNVNSCSGRDDWECFDSLTKSAAAGGITTIVDNPTHSLPTTTSVENLKSKIFAARNNIHVDIAFWAGITDDNENELIDLANNGVVGFKCLLSPGHIKEFSHLSIEKLENAMSIVEETNLPLAIHPELPTQRDLFKTDANPKKYDAYLATKPSSMETNAVETILNLAKEHKIKIHIHNLSSAESLQHIQKFRCDKKGKNLSIETCHHYLNLISEEIENGKTEFKASPPIRNNNNKSKLWEAVKSYEIDIISSNHCPSTVGAKCLIYGKNRGNFFEAIDGISSLQFGLPIFWSNCESYGLNFYDINRFLTLNPAKLLNLDKNKGKIAVGYDADFCIWDPLEEFTVAKEDIFYKNKISPYIGKKLRGKIYATVVRGYIVYDANNPTFDKPIGDVLLKRNVKKEKREIRFSDFDDDVDEFPE